MLLLWVVALIVMKIVVKSIAVVAITVEAIGVVFIPKNKNNDAYFSKENSKFRNK